MAPVLLEEPKAALAPDALGEPKSFVPVFREPKPDVPRGPKEPGTGAEVGCERWVRMMTRMESTTQAATMAATKRGIESSMESYGEQRCWICQER